MIFKKLLYLVIDCLVKSTKKEIPRGKGTGAFVDSSDPRDFELIAGGVDVSDVYIDKRKSPFITKVENQGSYNSCVSHAITSCLEYLAKREGMPASLELSRMDLYNNGRKRSGTYPGNNGMSVREAWKSAQKDGVTIEKLFPYTKSNFNKELDRSFVFAWYPRFRYVFISSRLTNNLKKESIVTVLEDKDMILSFAIPLMKSFLNHRGSSVYKPLPNEDVAYYHAMHIIGYSSAKKAFLIRNSWGSRWGMGGDAWVDEEYILSKAYSITYPEVVDYYG